MIRKLLLVAILILISISTENSILNRSDVSQAIRTIWSETESRSDSTEYCFTIEPAGVIFYTGAPYACTMSVYKETIATVHTHPSPGAPEPSYRDREDAKETKIPFYVISQRQIWVALPDGSTHLVSLR
jgi:proteasome lid subunit RPN8/RPN11